MTEFQGQEPLFNIPYQTPPPHGNASLLVRLAAIFNLVLAGLDLLFGIGLIAMAGFMYYTFAHMPAMVPPPVMVAPGAPPATAPLVLPPPAVLPPGALPAPAAPPPGLPSPMLFAAVYGIPGILSLLVIPFKIIGGVKLARRGKNVWGWGLAVGIIDCCELWMVMPCFIPLILPLATGIFTIVVLCFPQVREYLNTSKAS